MKKLLASIYLLILVFNSFGQSTKPQQKPSQAEIDRLAEKYESMSSIILYTSHGELLGDVEIVYNPDEQPQAIRITGTSTNKDAIADFLSGLIDQKIRQGYKNTYMNSEPTTADWIKEAQLGNEDGVDYTYKKNNMYFVAKGGCCKENSFNDTGTIYWFSIETGDITRKGGKKATQFDF